MDESTLALNELGASDESLAQLNHELRGATAELTRIRSVLTAAEVETEQAGRQLERLRDDVRLLVQENSALRVDNAVFLEQSRLYAKIHEQIIQLRNQLAEIHGSRAWGLVRKARDARARLIRAMTLPRRWKDWVRSIKPAAAGFRPSHSTRPMPATPSQLAIASTPPAIHEQAPAGVNIDAIPARPPMTFHELPWRRLSDSDQRGSVLGRSFPIVLIAAEETAHRRVSACSSSPESSRFAPISIAALFWNITSSCPTPLRKSSPRSRSQISRGWS